MKRALALAAVIVIGSWAAALAHGEVTTSEPKPGDRLELVPDEIRIDFAEPPTEDSRYEVLDGCRTDVFAGTEGRGEKKTLVVSGGQPGRWTVSYNIISATDGHHTQDRFSFTVAGTKDCEPSPSEESTGGDGGAAGREEGQRGNFPVLAVAVGAAIVAGAVLIRFGGR